MISLLSPSEVFRFIGSAICRSDVDSYHRFMERLRIYREEFIDFLKAKNIFSSFLYFTPQPPETFMTADEIVRIRTGGEFKTLHEYEEWASAHNGSFVPLRKVDIPGTSYHEYPFLDVSDVPRFNWQSTNILKDVRTVLLKIAGLMFGSIVLFYLAFLSFIKYDVR